MKHFTITDAEYELYINGKLTLTDLSKKYNVCHKTILNHLNKDGKTSALGVKRKYQSDDFFNVIDCEEKAYILGFYVGDGYITSNSFGIAIQEDDKEVLVKIRDIISPKSNLNYIKPKLSKLGFVSKPMYRLRISSKQIVEDLEKYKLGYNKTYIEKSVKNIVPTHLFKHFVRGYFDADGCINHTSGFCRHKEWQGEYHNYIWNIISKDRGILEEIKDFLIQNDIHPNIYPDQKGCFLISLTKRGEFKKLFELIYNDCSIFLERKRNKFNEILELRESHNKIND